MFILNLALVRWELFSRGTYCWHLCCSSLNIGLILAVFIFKFLANIRFGTAASFNHIIAPLLGGAGVPAAADATLTKTFGG